MRIESLQQYQRPRGAGRFADLPPDQRAVAEGHYNRLCRRWGDDLPQWRKAILVGRARDLVLRPRDANWGRELRKGHRRQPIAPVANPGTPPQPGPQPRIAAPLPHARASQPTPLTPSADPDRVTSLRAAVANVASSPTHQVASSLPMPSTLAPPSPHAVRLDVRGLTARGTDGQDSAQRILRDLELHAFGESPHFSIGVPGQDLPPGWAWRLEVVSVS